MLPARDRASIRRGVLWPCQVVTESDFCLIGDLCFDISPRGMGVRALAPAAIGEDVLVSFRIPRTSIFVDIEGQIQRLGFGRRDGDQGPALGVRFLRMDAVSRAVLGARLHGLPPPLPTRRARVDYAASILAMHEDPALQLAA